MPCMFHSRFGVSDPDLIRLLGLDGPDACTCSIPSSGPPTGPLPPTVILGDEEWRPVPGWDYEVSSQGRVRRVKVVTTIVSHDGYHRVNLYADGGRTGTRPLVHRLVADAFLSTCPPDKFVVAHRDGDPSHNVPDNLYWSTTVENMADRKAHGNRKDGEAALNAKLTNEQARDIRRLYHVGRRSVLSLARQFGVSRTVVKGIIINKGYRSAGGHGYE